MQLWKDEWLRAEHGGGLTLVGGNVGRVGDRGCGENSGRPFGKCD